MTITISNTSNTDTFSYWLNRTNELADAMTNKVITVNSNNATGNAYVNGTFSALVIAANTIVGGNAESSSVLTLDANLSITGTATITGTVNTSSLNIGGEIVNSLLIDSWNTVSNIIISTSANTSTTSSQIIDYFDNSVYRSAEYLLSIKDNNSNNYQVSKLLVLNDDSNVTADLVEYGVLYSNSILASFSANSNTTHVRLICTPVSSNTTIKGTRISLQV